MTKLLVPKFSRQFSSMALMVPTLYLTLMASTNADAHLFCMWQCNDTITWAVHWPNGCYNTPKCSDTYIADNQQTCPLDILVLKFV